MSPAPSVLPRRPLRLALTAPALAAALALLAPACSHDAGLDAFLARAQDAACERLVACLVVPDIASCKARSLGRLDAGPACLTDLIQAGVIAYHPEYEDTCITALRSGTCGYHTTIPDVAGACDAVLAGTIPPGGTCGGPGQCADSGFCAPNHFCFHRGDEGDPCGEVPEHVCSYATYCDGFQCQPLAKEGQRCADGMCRHGLYCAADTIRCTPTLALGAPCDAHDRGGPCGDGFCDPLTSRCAPLPAPHEDCTFDGLCGGDGSCIDGVCVGYPGEGERCLTVDVVQCALGLACDGNVCAVPAATTCR